MSRECRCIVCGEYVNCLDTLAEGMYVDERNTPTVCNFCLRQHAYDLITKYE